jgi:hypothetical protein
MDAPLQAEPHGPKHPSLAPRPPHEGMTSPPPSPLLLPLRPQTLLNAFPSNSTHWEFPRLPSNSLLDISARIRLPV